jgi:lipopolysaccharide transport system ATP-binding protein
VTILTADGLGKRYRTGGRRTFDIWALKDVSFSLERGTILGVIGPNGAGKTTLLKVLSRVTPPTEGRVIGHGRVVPLLALGAGFQQDLSGRDNVFLNAAMYGISAAEVEEVLPEIIAFADLDRFLDLPVKRYSSGMYLRLAFSVAINMRPDILLADEVLAVGDVEFQEKCLERVQESGRAGMTVLFVSHDMDAIARLCDQVLWLNSGQVVRIGAPDDVVSEYQSSALSAVNRGRRTRSSGIHVVKLGEITYVRLISATGKEMGAARVDHDLWLHVGFKTTVPNVKVRANVDLSAGGVAAFRSIQPAPTLVPEASEGTAKVRIPAHFLGETAYTVGASVAFFGEDEPETATLHNALTFNVYDPQKGDSARGSFRGRMPGVIAPRLDWDTETVPAALPAAGATTRE